jgi:hypothetical protein
MFLSFELIIVVVKFFLVSNKLFVNTHSLISSSYHLAMPISTLLVVATVPLVMVVSDALGFTSFFWRSKAYEKSVKEREMDMKKNPEKYMYDDIDPHHGYPRDLL